MTYSDYVKFIRLFLPKSPVRKIIACKIAGVSLKKSSCNFMLELATYQMIISKLGSMTFLIFIIWFMGRLLLIMLILCITLKATYPKVLCGLNLRRRIFLTNFSWRYFFFLLFCFGSLISNRFDHIGLRITSTASCLKRFNN